MDNPSPNSSIVARMRIDPNNDFDCWIAAWGLAQQRSKNLREMFLRLKLDDSDLPEEAENRMRALHFELSAAFLLEVAKLLESKKFYVAELNEGPPEITSAVEEAFAQLEQHLESPIGDAERSAKKVLEQFRPRVFHLPVKYKTGEPEKILRLALRRMAEDAGDGVELSVGPTVGTTNLTFTRHIDAAMLERELGIPADADLDERNRLMLERFKPLVGVVNDSIESLDKVMHALLILRNDRIESSPKPS